MNFELPAGAHLRAPWRNGPVLRRPASSTLAGLPPSQVTASTLRIRKLLTVTCGPTTDPDSTMSTGAPTCKVFEESCSIAFHPSGSMLCGWYRG